MPQHDLYEYEAQFYELLGRTPPTHTDAEEGAEEEEETGLADIWPYDEEYPPPDSPCHFLERSHTPCYDCGARHYGVYWVHWRRRVPLYPPPDSMCEPCIRKMFGDPDFIEGGHRLGHIATGFYYNILSSYHDLRDYPDLEPETRRLGMFR